MLDSTMHRINDAYGRDHFRDFEVDVDRGRSETLPTLPHKYSFQIFIDTVTIKLTIDIIIYISLVLYSVVIMILIAMEYKAYFQITREDYKMATAWINIMGKIEDDITVTIDPLSEDFITAEPLFDSVRKDHVDRLADLYIHSYVATALTSVCSFRTPVNILFASLTDRPYKVTDVTKIDFFLIIYWVFWLVIFGVYEQEKYVPQFFYDVDLVDKSSSISRFSGAMLWTSEAKNFRYDFVTGVFAVGNTIKVLL